MVSHDELVGRTDNNLYGKTWQLMWLGNAILYGGLFLWWPFTFLNNHLISGYYPQTQLIIGRDVGLYFTGLTFGSFLLTLIFFEKNAILSSTTVWLEILALILWEALSQFLHLTLFDDASHYLAHKTGQPTYLTSDQSFKQTLI